MNVELITYTGAYGPKMGAAICTESGNPARALDAAIASGHESVLEHSVFTFRITGISRVTLAQLTRHRIASYSVKSQRYVDHSQAPSVMPPSVAADEMAEAAYKEAISYAHRVYDMLLRIGIPKEDARYILPEATTTDLLVTMNARELRHFFSMRCCHKAQWEIQDLANQMFDVVESTAPELFADAGPGCVRGHCPESKPCGHPVAKEGRP